MRRTSYMAAMLLLPVLLVWQGCSSLGDNDDLREMGLSLMQQDARLLVGAWQWQSDTHYRTADGRPHRVTPVSSGRTEMLVFSDDGTVEVYTNGELERTVPYEVKTRTYFDGTKTGPHLYIGEHGSPAQFGVSGSTLVISTAAMDGPESAYQRVE